ncbi:MAG: hypothetical protein P8Y25_11625, partial [Chromatiaceae bacterium]
EPNIRKGRSSPSRLLFLCGNGGFFGNPINGLAKQFATLPGAYSTHDGHRFHVKTDTQST